MAKACCTLSARERREPRPLRCVAQSFGKLKALDGARSGIQKAASVLNKYLVARVFAFDDHESEARAACVAKGWEDVSPRPDG